MKTSDLIGHALDWAVAKCEGYGLPHKYSSHNGSYNFPSFMSYGTDWAQAGPIIEREKIDCICDPNGTAGWMGRSWINGKEFRLFGLTPLVAAMRCYVASKLGDEVSIPEGMK